MPERIYAEVETGDGVPREGQPTDTGRLFRSDDAGKSWQLVSSDLQPAGRTAYYDRMGVEPDNPNEAYFLASNFTKTLDGGKTMIDLPRGAGSARRPSRHSGSIHRTATDSPSRTTADSASRPLAAERGIASSCRSRRCIT